ncbi:MAG: CBS domain-containing protein [Methanobacteriaceae archaeon]
MKDKTGVTGRRPMHMGSIDHETKIAEHDGDIMVLGKKEVVSIPQTTTIKETAHIMVENNFRRLPVTDPGSGKILGIVTAMDILDFLGGGDKFNLMEKRYDDNFLAAINAPVKEIMSRNIISMSKKGSMGEAITKMMENDIGVIPIIDDNEKLVGIVSERDFATAMAGVLTEEIVDDFMATDVITITPGTPIESVTKIMVRNNFKRIPVVEDEEIVGIVTANDILIFLGENKFSEVHSTSGLSILSTSVSEIMENEVKSVVPLTRVGDFCEILEKDGIGGVPVIKDGKIVGMITERDILHALYEK